MTKTRHVPSGTRIIQVNFSTLSFCRSSKFVGAKCTSVGTFGVIKRIVIEIRDNDGVDSELRVDCEIVELYKIQTGTDDIVRVISRFLELIPSLLGSSSTSSPAGESSIIAN